MKQMPDNCVDLTVTSPPYDNLRDYKGFVFDFEGIAQQLYRVTKQGGVVVWVVGDATIDGSETCTSAKQKLYFKEIGFNVHDTMIYHSEGLTLNHRRYEQEFEYMFVFSKGDLKTFNPIKIACKWYKKDSDRTGQKTGFTTEKKRKLRSGIPRGTIKPDKIKGNIWKYTTGYLNSTSDRYAFKHPAVFPEKLAKDHITSWCNEGETVLDPMCGSGTTAKMASLMGRNYIGIEISPEYCEIARKRVQEAKDSMGLFKD
jgi:site-specific DNA-methyltransferase (adenine-specific)